LVAIEKLLANNLTSPLLPDLRLFGKNRSTRSMVFTHPFWREEAEMVLSLSPQGDVLSFQARAREDGSFRD